MKKNLIDNKNAFEQEELFNIKSAAQYLGLSVGTVRNWAKSGNLKSLKQGACFLFHQKDLESTRKKLAEENSLKLKGRANKTNITTSFIPKEYVKEENSIQQLQILKNFIQEKKIETRLALFLITLNYLQRKEILTKINSIDEIKRCSFAIKHDQIKNEIQDWYQIIPIIPIDKNLAFLLHFELPQQRDVLGLIYQALLQEGHKSANGSYYTPAQLVDEIVRNHVKEQSKVLDPCCGTGQFLLAFSDVIKEPSHIYGIDSDEIAVRIARINLLLSFKDKNFKPNIICADTLLNKNLNIFQQNRFSDFDVIASNPPWGGHFSDEIKKQLKENYPNLTSFESFSYFLQRSSELLKKDGKLIFILPESILNVKIHKDIRQFLLQNMTIKKIQYLYRIFKNVFTPVIRLDLQKTIALANEVKIIKEKETYLISQANWQKNIDSVFNIHTNEKDVSILEKIFDVKHTNLKNQADWALGIVTGDNDTYLSNTPLKGYKPIFKGKDIKPFSLQEPTCFIKFQPDQFQQIAPLEKYEAKEKLIYRFISNRLVFAYDDKQYLTLNSANLVIPHIADYPMLVIAALLNSSLYQFIFQKKFSSIKVLKNHLEQMPLPLWGENILSKILTLATLVKQSKQSLEILDDFIFNQYLLSSEEIAHIKENIKSSHENEKKQKPLCAF